MSGPLVDVDGRHLRLSNLDKVLYPTTGTTKGDVIGYYSLRGTTNPYVAAPRSWAEISDLHLTASDN